MKAEYHKTRSTRLIINWRHWEMWHALSNKFQSSSSFWFVCYVLFVLRGLNSDSRWINEWKTHGWEGKKSEFNFSESIHGNLGYTKFRHLVKFNVVWLSKRSYFKTIKWESIVVWKWTGREFVMVWQMTSCVLFFWCLIIINLEMGQVSLHILGSLAMERWTSGPSLNFVFLGVCLLLTLY